MTNREWLNTMTDEELAEELAKKNCKRHCVYIFASGVTGNYHCGLLGGKTCKDGIVAWLKEEHKEENND